MDHSEIARRRMVNLRLWDSDVRTVEEVVGGLGAMQAQEFPFAKWSVAQRAHGIDAAAMERAFADGVLLRSHFLRPTWHFALPADIRWILQVTAPRVHAFNAHYYRKMELDDALLAKTDALLGEAVRGGNHLTRKELAQVLAGAGIEASGVRLAFVVIHAELEGVVTSGAPRGKQHTYALLEERAPTARTMDPDEALAELTRRYFTARGPATVKDFMWWSSLRAAEVRRGLDLAGSALERLEEDGRTYWSAPPSAEPAARRNVVDLVQAYDEAIMSYTESRDVLGGRPARYYHGILLDGRLIGSWRPVLERGSVVVETERYRDLTKAEAQGLDSAVARYAAFLGVPVTLRAG
jgi:hypothetical protein